MQTLNIFYQEPDPDRWFKYDRYPRKLIRRIVRGKLRPGGIMMVALQLMKGLDQLNIPYRFNDFRYADQHPEETICLIGKPQLLFDRKWKNPIVFGPGTYSHPIDCPDLFTRYANVKKIVVAGEWMKNMFSTYYKEENIAVWPAGIDTDEWSPAIKAEHQHTDFLIYDKIMWEQEEKRKRLLTPVINVLETAGLTYNIIRYGSYTHESLKKALAESKSVIFLCEHETQGMAYQQMLATNTPVFAWDQNSYWEDPSYYPDKVKYGPVSSVPYWDERCGLKFTDLDEFKSLLTTFIEKLAQNEFSPRSYVLEHLTLEKSAKAYYNIVANLNTSASA